MLQEKNKTILSIALTLLVSIATLAQSSKKFSAGYKYSNGFSKIVLNGKYGYIDKEGSLAIPCVFDYSNDFSNNFAIVRNEKN